MTITLPNGLTVRDSSKTGCRIIYDEIFVQQVYAKHGITIEDGNRILDAGANVGLFALWASSFATVEIHCYEPCESTFYDLGTNLNKKARTAANRSVFVCVNLGLWPHACRMPMTRSGISQINRVKILDLPERDEVDVTCGKQVFPWLPRFLIRWYLWLADRSNWSKPAIANFVPFPPGPWDLVKLDIEGAELPVLRTADLSDTKQIVVEVHRTEDVPLITAILTDAGFNVVADRCGHMDMVYARRGE